MLIVLVVAFVGLLGAVFLQGRLQDGPVATPNTPVVVPTPAATLSSLDGLPPVFEDFRVGEIREIQLAEPNGNAVLRLERSVTGDEWTAPELEGDIDAEAAQLIAGTVVILPYLKIVPTSPQTDLSAFGFVNTNTEALSVEVRLLDGTRHIVFLGGQTPDSNGFYAIVDEREGFYVLDARPIAFLRQQLRNPPTRLTSD